MLFQAGTAAVPAPTCRACSPPAPRSATQEPCANLFCPIYSLAASPDPLLPASYNATHQLHMAVGLDSGEQRPAGRARLMPRLNHAPTQQGLPCRLPPAGLAASDFRRPRLNVLVLLDVSGSMGSSFQAYYYDQANASAPSSEDGEVRIAAFCMRPRRRPLPSPPLFPF